MSDKNSDMNLAKRVTELELNKNNADRKNDAYFDSYKAYTTILFTALALLVGILGVLSRIEVRDQVKDMQASFEKQESDMQKQFNALAGEALKKPRIEILGNGEQLLDGQTLDVFFSPDWTPSGGRLDGIFIRNTGDKTTEPIAIRISVAAKINFDYSGSREQWEQTLSPEKDFAVVFNSLRQITVHPGETLNVPLTLDYRSGDATNTECKIEVFYGESRPATSRFNITFKTR